MQEGETQKFYMDLQNQCSAPEAGEKQELPGRFGEKPKNFEENREAFVQNGKSNPGFFCKMTIP